MAAGFQYEEVARSKGAKLVAGLDEAGRGPLAGPVVAAAVILDETKPFWKKHPVKDSKQHTPKQRKELIEIIKANALAWGVGIADHHTIDDTNIRRATFGAFKLSVKDLGTRPDYLLIDGPITLVEVPINQTGIIKGDQKSVSIAAASIIAKETRDEMMLTYDEQYPVYGFAKHKGYGTKQHFSAIEKFGPCPIHRLTFAPFK